MSSLIKQYKENMLKLTGDFNPFYSEMLAELERHVPEKGFSYRERAWRIKIQMTPAGGWDPRSAGGELEVEVTAIEALNRRIEEAVDEWKETRDPSQLVDIANLCAMNWLHENGFFNEKEAS